jgi:4,4'-diaponeurosporenoate glycosyltransferase
MYPQGWGELKAGWSKAFATGAAQTPPGLLLLIMAWLAGSLLAAGGLAGAVMRGAPCGPWLAVYGVYAAQLYAMLIRIGSFRWFVALLYPVPLLFYMVVFMHSVIRAGLRKDVSWKGRHIDLTEEG